jgi:predicted XRE-type DNA-binding protein
MDSEKRKALEAAGFRLGDAADFLALTEAERRLVELRVNLAQAIRRRREQSNLSQKQVAARIKSSQPRVAKIEAAAADVSLDQMFRGLFAVGGNVEDLTVAAPTEPRAPRRQSKKPGTPIGA